MKRENLQPSGKKEMSRGEQKKSLIITFAHQVVQHVMLRNKFEHGLLHVRPVKDIAAIGSAVVPNLVEQILLQHLERLEQILASGLDIPFLVQKNPKVVVHY